MAIMASSLPNSSIAVVLLLIIPILFSTPSSLLLLQPVSLSILAIVALFVNISLESLGSSPNFRTGAKHDADWFFMLAEDGVGLPEEVLEQSCFESSAKLYFAYTNLDFFWTLNYFALIVLCFLEKPLWCDKNNGHSCNERDYYFLGQLPYLTSIQSLIFELITFIILVVHILFPISFEGSDLYWKKTLNTVKVILLSLMAVDILIYVLYLSPVAFSSLPFRISPYIRVIFFVFSIRELSRSVIVLAGMIPTYLNVLALTLMFLLFSSWIAYIMFEDTKQGDEVFTSYGSTLYKMFVLFTTYNYPDVWIPAYKVSRWYSLFFVLYILLGVYFITSLILAVVYDSFKSELAKQVAEMDSKRKHTLAKAFKLIDRDNLGHIDKQQCSNLFTELNKYRTLPNISEEDFERIFYELDDSGDFKINQEEFAAVCHIIALKFSKEDCESYFEYLPFYNSTSSAMLKRFVRGQTFGSIIAIILVINLIAVIIESTLDIQDNSAQKVWQVIEFVLGWIYVLEMVLKIYAYGFVNYWRDGQNQFDFIITCVIVVGETVTFAWPHGQTFLSNGEWIRYLILARVLRLTRLLMHVKRYRAFIATFLNLVPSLMPYLGIVFCVMCIYSSLGVQLFGGLVNAGNPLLEGTVLAEYDYLLFNFNDYPNAMVTTFNLVVLGNSQIWMQTYTDLMGTSWTLLYFVSFFLITVVLILNLIVAFVLEAFFAELELEKSEESAINEEEEKSESRRGRMTKTRSIKVDLLLHRILRSKLETSVGPTDGGSSGPC